MPHFLITGSNIIFCLLLLINVQFPINGVKQQAGTSYPPPPASTSVPTITPTVGVSITATMSPTEGITPTTTLMPLPEFTLNFPLIINSPTGTTTPVDNNHINTINSVTSEPNTNIPPRLRALAIVLVILWILLAGFLIIYVRQLL